MPTILSTEYELLRVRPQRRLVSWCYPGESYMWSESLETSISFGQHIPRVPEGPPNVEDHLAAFLGTRLYSPSHL